MIYQKQPYFVTYLDMMNDQVTSRYVLLQRLIHTSK